MFLPVSERPPAVGCEEKTFPESTNGATSRKLQNIILLMCFILV